jgi:hypothetical protein
VDGDPPKEAQELVPGPRDIVKIKVMLIVELPNFRGMYVLAEHFPLTAKLRQIKIRVI